jgi:hypothetical protein
MAAAASAGLGDAIRALSLLTDDVAYLHAASRNFMAFLADTSLSRRNYGYRTRDLLAIQSLTRDPAQINPELIGFFFNSAQREAIKAIRRDVRDADLDVYFPAPPMLAASAQDVLQRLDQPLLLRAMAQGGRGRGGGGYSFRGGGRGRHRGSQGRANGESGGGGGRSRSPASTAGSHRSGGGGGRGNRKRW